MCAWGRIGGVFLKGRIREERAGYHSKNTKPEPNIVVPVNKDEFIFGLAGVNG